MLSRRQLSAMAAYFTVPWLKLLPPNLSPTSYTAELPSAADMLSLVQPMPVPEFQFQNSRGQWLTPQKFKGQGVVVSLWATWCAPCRWELPTLARLAIALRSDGIQVLPIAVASGDVGQVQDYFQGHEIRGLPVLVDPSATAFVAIQENTVPLTMVITKTGNVMARAIGGADWSTQETIIKLRKWLN